MDGKGGDMSELKPCPFCHKKPRLWNCSDDDSLEPTDAMCDTAGCAVFALAIPLHKWNHRALDVGKVMDLVREYGGNCDKSYTLYKQIEKLLKGEA